MIGGPRDGTWVQIPAGVTMWRCARLRPPSMPRLFQPESAESLTQTIEIVEYYRHEIGYGDERFVAFVAGIPEHESERMGRAIWDWLMRKART